MEVFLFFKVIALRRFTLELLRVRISSESVLLGVGSTEYPIPNN